MGDLAEYMSNQITLLNKATGADADLGIPSNGTRYIGGHNRTNQPFISGYHQVIFTLPTSNLVFRDGSSPNAIKWLSSTCEGFTPHSSNINFVDVNGIGQLGSSFPASRTYNREFTLTFREYQSLPILNIFRTWNGLFDPHLGISTLKGADFVPVNYKGSATVAILKPTTTEGVITADDIEEIYMYEGVFPTGVPEDTVVAADQATNDSVQASVTFKFDGAPLDKSSDALIEFFVKTASTEFKYMESYNQLGSIFA